MFRSLMQAFSRQKLDVRVPHSKGLSLTDENKFGEDAESTQAEGQVAS